MSAVATTTDPTGVEALVVRALAVPTRAAIYRWLRTEGRARSAREAAERVGIHPNVARAHLDVLVAAGLAIPASRHNPLGGRPAKVYVAREQAAPSLATVGPDAPPVALAPRPVGDGAALGVQTALQLVAGLREHVARAELLAEERGRRLVGAATLRAASRDLDAALLATVEALRPTFTEVRLQPGPEGSSVLHGVRSDLDVVAVVESALADALAVGFVRGALAAAGASAEVSVADGAIHVRPGAGDGSLPLPAASIDARGLTFDRGVVRAMRAIAELRPGAHLEVLSDEVGAPAAYARWADRAGHRIVAVDRVRDLAGRRAVRILLRRAAA
jgi:predicted ArsR family transcriptional regulator/TusA-related sulfurtransferase